MNPWGNIISAGFFKLYILEAITCSNWKYNLANIFKSERPTRQEKFSVTSAI